jgi:hypothetical protein
LFPPSFSEPPDAPTFTGWPTNSVLIVGETLMLTCIAASTGGRPDHYKWYHGTSVLPYSGTMGETYKTTVTVSDAGPYKCIAFNAGGQAESSIMTLSVQSKFRPGLISIKY